MKKNQLINFNITLIVKEQQSGESEANRDYKEVRDRELSGRNTELFLRLPTYS